MKIFTKFSVPLLLIVLISINSYGQRKHDDATVTIRINGKEEDIEEYFENWGEEFERKMEKAFDHSDISININNDDFEFDFNNLCVDLGDMAESIAEAVTDAVSHMNIEVNDIDPEDFDKSDFDFDDGEDLDEMIDDIEDQYDSEVKKIDKMKIKIREDYVKIEMNVTLENGKKIDKVKIYAH